MKSVLISIQPKWCELIASGKKTVEVRKTKPKLDVPFKCYIYMTKAYDTLFGYGNPKKLCVDGGKVIGEFVCDDIGEFKVFENGSVQYWNYHELGKTCLTYDELSNYIGRNKNGYGWHISDLVIYDKPRELSGFHKPIMPTGLRYEDDTIARPPQSWCYVESEAQL